MMMQRTRWEHVGPFALALGCLAAAAWGALPESSQEGPLLATVTLEGEVAVGVYGPQPAGEGEPAVIGVVLDGSESVTLTAGLVVLAFRREAVSFANVPMPSGAIIPFGQWAPDFDSETRQLLCLNAGAQWALRLAALAPLEFAGGPGEVLDAVVFGQAWTQLPAGPVFRDISANELAGAVFLADETLRRGSELAKATHGAHRVLLTVPVVFKDPGSPFSVWVAFTANGRQITHQLAVSVTPRQTEAVPEAVDEGPAVAAPEEGALVGRAIPVSGQARTPGALVVAWLQAPGTEEAPAKEAKAAGVVRTLSRQDGGFSFELAVPPEVGEGAELTLHVRTEAPGYKSPETTRKVVVRAEVGETQPGETAAPGADTDLSL